MVIVLLNLKLELVLLMVMEAQESLMAQEVFLEIWVKVRSGWADDEARVRSFGYQ